MNVSLFIGRFMADVTSFLPLISDLSTQSPNLIPTVLTASGSLPFVFKSIRGLVKLLFILCGVAGISLFMLPKLLGSNESYLNSSTIETAKEYLASKKS